MKNKTKVETVIPKQSKINDLCIVFRAENILSHAKEINESISRLRLEQLKNLEFIFISKELFSIEDLAGSSLSKYPEKIQIATFDETPKVSDKKVLFVDCEDLSKAFNPGEFFGLKLEANEKNVRLHFLNKEKKSKKAFWLLSDEVANYILNLNIASKDFDYIFKKERIRFSKVPLNQTSVFEEKNSFGIRMKQSFQRFINWYLLFPIRELRLKKEERGTFIGKRESSIYRLLFFSLAIALFFIMPILSLNVGISGDEFVNYEHSEKVYDYYMSGDKSAVDPVINPKLNSTLMQYYGQSFDNITYFVNRIIGTDNPYESRHVMNSLVGWLIILVAGLFLSHVAGWRAALIGMLLLFISPRFLGHSYNNPKDIPFAFAYLFSIFQMVLWAKEMPEIKIKRLIYVVLGIAMAISVRVGGMMLMAFLFMIIGLWYLTSRPLKDFFKASYWSGGFRLIFLLTGLSIASFFVGIILWPYAIESPIKHAQESLDIMTNFSVGIRQLFNGENIWSDKAPWDYLPKYIFMTIPIVVIIGLGVFIASIKKVLKNTNELVVFIIVFSFFFPVWYIIYQKSNVYGGWRHVLFIYPFMVMAATLGFEALFTLLKNRYLKISLWVILIGFIFLPLRHIAKNHPHEYVYYNELAGGIDKAYGFYETDYYFHSMRTATLWLRDYIKKEDAGADRKMVIVSNNMGITQYYMRHDTATMHVGYIRYYERGTIDWDYCIVVNSYIDAYQLQNNIWPPKNTIHTIDVDGKPICAILKRENREDFFGHEAKMKADNIKENSPEKMEFIEEAIHHFEKSVEHDINNETALLSLSELYMNMQKLDTAMLYIDKLLTINPNYENGLNYKGWISLQLYDNSPNPAMLEDAAEAFGHIIQVNYKFIYGYYGLAMVYVRKNDVNNALRVLEDGMKINPQFPPIVQLYNQLRTYNKSAF